MSGPPPPLPSSSKSSHPVKKSWKDTTKPQLKFDPSVLSSVPSLVALNWSSLSAIHKAPSGSGFTWFIEFPNSPEQTNRRALVLKTSTTLASEVFGQRLAELLNVRVPESRLLTSDDPELFQLSYFSLKTLSLQTNGSLPSGVGPEPDLASLLQLERSVIGGGGLNKPFVLISEFIPGEPLTGLSSRTSVQSYLFKDSTTFSETGVSFLRSIGRIVCLDILSNNSDRFPLPNIWEYELNFKPEGKEQLGNLANLLIHRETKQIYAIDNAVNCIKEERAQNYLRRVKDFLEKCKAAKTSLGQTEPNLEHFQPVVLSLEQCLDLKLGREAAIYIFEGFLETSQILSQPQATEKILSIYGDLNHKFTNILQNYGSLMNQNAFGLSLLDSEFLKKIVQLFSILQS